jgi:hypothetical protein
MLRSSSQTVQLQGDASNQMSVWQPIDTAPDKEGSRALLFDGKDQFVGVLTRYNRHGQWRLWTGDRPAPWGGQKPTHWMALPEPPESTGRSEAKPEAGAAAAEPTPGEIRK